MSRKDNFEEMTPLSPEDSGTGFIIHVYQDLDRRTRRGPQIKVFPGRPSAGGGVSISICEGERPTVITGDTTNFDTTELAKAVAFVQQNRDVLLRYWRDDLHSTRQLLDDLKPVG